MDIDEIKLFNFIKSYFRNPNTPSHQMAKRMNQRDFSISQDDLAQECFIFFFGKSSKDGELRYKKIKTKAGLKIALDNFTRREYVKIFPKKNYEELSILHKIFKNCFFSCDEIKYTLIVTRFHSGLKYSGTSESPFRFQRENIKFYLKILLKILDYSIFIYGDYDILEITKDEMSDVKLIKSKYMNGNRINLYNINQNILKSKGKGRSGKKINDNKAIKYLKDIIRKSIRNLMGAQID